MRIMRHKPLDVLTEKTPIELDITKEYHIENDLYQFIRSTKSYHYFIKNRVIIIKMKREVNHE